VITINPDSLESHQKWAKKHGFEFPLLVDADGAVCAAYGVAKPGGGTQRAVYVVDPAGTIVFAKAGLPDDSEILAAIPVGA
jgi:peroxiredoxin Q/BCP